MFDLTRPRETFHNPHRKSSAGSLGRIVSRGSSVRLRRWLRCRSPRRRTISRPRPIAVAMSPVGGTRNRIGSPTRLSAQCSSIRLVVPETAGSDFPMADAFDCPAEVAGLTWQTCTATSRSTSRPTIRLDWLTGSAPSAAWLGQPIEFVWATSGQRPAGLGPRRVHVRRRRRHPGVSRDDLPEMTAFPIHMPDRIAGTPGPGSSERAAIERVDPVRPRRLEFLPAARRLNAVEEALELESRYVVAVA